MASIIEKGSDKHNAHLAGLKVASKDGDGDAEENVKQHKVKNGDDKKDK